MSQLCDPLAALMTAWVSDIKSEPAPCWCGAATANPDGLCPAHDVGQER